jgi:predicted Zn-dependent protease
VYSSGLELSSRRLILAAVLAALAVPVLAWAGTANLSPAGEVPSNAWRDRGDAPDSTADDSSDSENAPPQGEAADDTETKDWPNPLPQRVLPGRLDEARELMAKRRWGDAAPMLKALLNERPGSVRIALDLSRALMELGQREGAMGALAPLVAMSPGPMRDLVTRRLAVLSEVFRTNDDYQAYQDALNLLVAGKPKEGHERFAKLLKREPAHVRVLLRNAQCLFQSGETAEALDALQTAHKLNPMDAEVNVWLGHALAQSGRVPEGLKLLQDSTASGRDSELAPRWYAEALLTQRQRDRAVEVLTADIDKHPLHLSSLTFLADLRAGDFGTGSKSLWQARSDLQLALSRFQDYQSERTRPSASEPEWIPWAPQQVRLEIDELLGRVESRLNARGSTTSPAPKPH